MDEYIAYFANPPEAALVAAPANMKEILNDLETLEERQDADIQVMAEVLFQSREADDLTSEARLATLRRDWKMFLGYLIRKERTQIRKINRNTLRGFRSELAGVLKEQSLKLRTIDGYLAAARTVLRWCETDCNVKFPAYSELLANFSQKEVTGLAKQAGYVPGNRKFGESEIIVWSTDALRAWLEAVMDDPFDYAWTMCSLNLAAGAADLSQLPVNDPTMTNGVPCVDMERKLFIASRSKTFEKRWTQIVDGDLVIPMMNRTHTAVGRWLAYRESLVAELSDRREMFRRIQRASEARRLAKEGRNYREIAATLDIPVGSVGGILKQAGDRREHARSLALAGHSVKDIVALTGFSQGSVSSYVRDITAERKRRPRGNRHMIVDPDPNLLFFVPSTGRPLDKNSIRDRFERVCRRAGIIREADIEAGRVEGPTNGAFVLPRNNGQYIFRRTAATVAGVLGRVPEDILQRFMAHKKVETTRRYIHDPPAGYEGPRVRHDFSFKLTESEDPTRVIEEFLDHLLNDG